MIRSSFALTKITVQQTPLHLAVLLARINSAPRNSLAKSLSIMTLISERLMTAQSLNASLEPYLPKRVDSTSIGQSLEHIVKPDGHG